MNILNKKNMMTLLFAASLLPLADRVEAAPGLDFSAMAPYENGGPNTFGISNGYTVVGWKFSPKTDLFLTKLGVYDADKDRMHSEQHQVGIWSSADSASPLASVIIDENKGNIPVASSPGNALFHFESLAAPIKLIAGMTYYVGATLYSGTVTQPGQIPNSTDFDSFASINGDVPVTINPYINYLGNAYATSSSNALVLPNLSYSEAAYTIGANIDVTPTPIPAAAWLLGSGLLGLVGMRRRQQ